MSTDAIQINKDDSESNQQLATNLQMLLDGNNLNINQLANALGIPMMTIRRLASGETTDPRISTIKLIADYFGVTVDSLFDNNNQTFTKIIKNVAPQFVPILTWEQVEKTANFSDINLTKWENWQTVSVEKNDVISKNAFALESRPSMYPRFPQGTIFVIDPKVTPSDGDIVLIKIRENGELTLRELVVDPPEWKLHPVINGSSVLQYSGQHHKIVGVNLLTMLYNRRTLAG